MNETRIAIVAFVVGAIVRAGKTHLPLPARAWPWVALALGAILGALAAWLQDGQTSPAPLVRAGVEGLVAGAAAIAGHEAAKGALPESLRFLLGWSRDRGEGS